MSTVDGIPVTTCGIVGLIMVVLVVVFAFLGGLLIPVLARVFEYGETLAEKLFGR